MTDGTTLRLDTVDLALEAGWQVESILRADEFSKDGVTIEVEYTPGDDIIKIARSKKGRDHEVFGLDSPGIAERLRIWLGVRAVPSPKSIPEGGNTSGIPITVQHLRAKGMRSAAYVKDGNDIQLLKVANNDSYGTARDYIRAYDGRARVMWKRDGSVSEPGPDQEMWWAEMPLSDGRTVGWFGVNPNYSGR